MTATSNEELREAFADVLSGCNDPEMLRLVRDLHARCGGRPVPPNLRTRIESGVRARAFSARRHRTFPRWNRVITPLIAALLLAIFTGSVLAVQSVVNLGKPTSNVPLAPNPPLGAFHRTGPFLHQGSKPELLFLGTMVDDYSSIERWPVVKALLQFGTFTGISGTEQRTCTLIVASGQSTPQVQCAPAGDHHGIPGGDATYNLEQARYHSRYVAFSSRDMIDGNLQVAHSVPASELGLYREYVRNTQAAALGIPGEDGIVWNTALISEDGSVGNVWPGNYEAHRRAFPLISIDGYLQTGVQVAIPGDLLATNNAIIPFDIVQRVLAGGLGGHLLKPKEGSFGGGVFGGSVSKSLVTDVNSEANVITALICHADGSRPGGVCHRPAIKALLRHVK